jgi:diguanylate cyclase (GGDEF)-like protein/PAS domain S-box-containing protein
MAAVALNFVALVVALMSSRPKSVGTPVQSTFSDSVEADVLPTPSLRYDNRYHLVSANRAFNESFGFPLHTTMLTQLWHPDDWEQDREVLIREGLPPRSERRLFRADGSMMWASITTVPENSGVRLFIEDVSRRSVAESQLVQMRDAIHDLYEVVAGGDDDLGTKSCAVLAMGCRRFGVETGLFGQIQENRLKVLQVVSQDDRIRVGQVYDLAAEGTKRAKGTSLTHPKGPRGLVHVDFANVKQEQPFFTSNENETYLGAPVLVNGNIYGMLNFSGSDPRETPFSEEDTEFLQLIAQWLGGEIERRQARAELERQQKQLLEANQMLERLATHDGLTGAKNRRAFDEQLNNEFRRARRYGTQLSILLLDVDKFKQFNDTFGHPEGDVVLKKVAQVLQSGVRNIDFVARYGGEEFVVLLPNTDKDGAMVLADRLRHKIESQDWKLREVTASFGAATLVAAMEEPHQLTAAADIGLYQSKAHGRNRVTHIQDVDPNAIVAH